MASLLFIHGTGVRNDNYDKTLAVIQKHVPSAVPCYWGDLGAKLHFEGASIPAYSTARAVEIVRNEDAEIVLWRSLVEDPLYELRMLSSISSPAEELAPNQIPPGRAWRRKIEQLQPTEKLNELLETTGLKEVWPKAYQAVVDQLISEPLNADGGEERMAVARAMVASAMVLGEEQGLPMIDGELRDHLVDLIVDGLGGSTRGLGGWVWDRIKGIAAHYGTRKARRKRGALTDITSPIAGDILFYQTRGGVIRDFIRQRIEAASPPVTILAHSLGGIACVDLLVMTAMPAVNGLITAGSQAPYLYEIDCLTSLRVNELLPDHFPRWLNFYDPNDFLSYIGKQVFPERVRDVEIQSRQPFPQSHSAYWMNRLFWNEVEAFLQ